MGEVWSAQDTDLDREVAVKILLHKLAEDRDYVRRFEREMKALAKLVHPNIAQIYTSGRTPNGQLCMVMQRVQGITVRRALKSSGGKLDLVSALFYTMQVAEVLLVAHRSGIAHRDVKPENVMVTEDGHAWLMDFGIAQSVRGPVTEPKGAGDAKRKAEGSRLMGTLRYMAPELIRDGVGDHRTDFYSLGVMLYELCTGKHPYGDIDDDDETGIQGAHLFGDIVPIAEVAPELPESLQRVLDKMLTKAPEERYQHAADVLKDLRDLLRESVPPEHPIAKAVESDRMVQKRKRAFARREAERASPPPEDAAQGTESNDDIEDTAPSRPPIGVTGPLRGWLDAEAAEDPAPARDNTQPVPNGSPRLQRVLPFVPAVDPLQVAPANAVDAEVPRTTLELPPGHVSKGLGAPFPIAPPRANAPSGQAPIASAPNVIVPNVIVVQNVERTARGTVIMRRPAIPQARTRGDRFALGLVVGMACAIVAAGLVLAIITVARDMSNKAAPAERADR